MSRNIVILSDGTGNSAASITKTNVWRLYRSLDLHPDPPCGGPPQIAIYRDGVGTSAFKPLALLGGIFGVGLGSNVVELYKALCRTYQNGDRIYAFGFSRGAFTIRVLVGLVCTQGILKCATEEDLAHYAPEIYRRYRRRYKLPLCGSKYDEMKPEETVGLVDVIRNMRDAVIGAWRRVTGVPSFAQTFEARDATGVVLPVSEVQFVGVWDTVAAYGLPLDELTRGIDEWFWPLSMPDYVLSRKVQRARHALALDEERDSFRPLLWDEQNEPPLRGDGTDRLLQVWFAGVHANVGGGYPDDTLSVVPLDWMKQEASDVGLRFAKPPSEMLPPASPFGRRYDSRAGVAGYYRYQPRKLRAYLPGPGIGTRILRDPRRSQSTAAAVGPDGAAPPEAGWFLRRIIVHDSVVDRIAHGQDRYAPIGLAGDVGVLSSGGRMTPLKTRSTHWESRQEWVWSDVWRRRVNYFLVVGVSALLAAAPSLPLPWSDEACEGPQCLLSGPIRLVGSLLPAFADTWVQWFARNPGTFTVLSGAIMLLMARSTTLEQRIRDGARELWAQELGVPMPSADARTAAGESTTGPDGRLFRFRTSGAYQRILQWMKWRGLPGGFGVLLLTLFGALLYTALVPRTALPLATRLGALCRDAKTATDTVDTRDPCGATGRTLRAGTAYTLMLQVPEPWRDASLPATPNGLVETGRPWYMALAVPARRHLDQPWFRLMARVGSDIAAPDWRRVGGRQDGQPREVWTATLTPSRTGQLFLYVNDAALLPGGWPFYGNNDGRATLVVTPPAE